MKSQISVALIVSLALLSAGCETGMPSPDPNAAALAGPEGPQGLTGETGAQGPAGPQGEAGADGQLRIYGDGSAGDVVVSADSTLSQLNDKGNYQFNDLVIEAGVTLHVASGTVIRCAGDFVNEGSIIVDHGPAGGFYGSMHIAPEPGVSASGAAVGEFGPEQYIQDGGWRGMGLTLEAALVLTDLEGGGGGGYGGFSNGGNGGGGLLILVGGVLDNRGEINADGENGPWAGSGGGAGGVVLMASRTQIVNAGMVSASGGSGGTSGGNLGAGGGAGGGIVHFFAPAIDSTAGTVLLDGGEGGAVFGSAVAGLRAGGGGGGACGGNGGMGGDVSNAPFNTLSPAGDGAAGHFIESLTDPTALF